MSGVVCVLAVMYVEKFGPICLNMFAFTMLCIPIPTVLLLLSPSVWCFALRSAKIYVGVVLESRLWKSGYGKKNLLGGMYVVAKLTGPIEVSMVSCSISVIKSSLILCWMLCLTKIALPSCNSLVVFTLYVLYPYTLSDSSSVSVN